MERYCKGGCKSGVERYCKGGVDGVSKGIVN